MFVLGIQDNSVLTPLESVSVSDVRQVATSASQCCDVSMLPGLLHCGGEEGRYAREGCQEAVLLALCLELCYPELRRQCLVAHTVHDGVA